MLTIFLEMFLIMYVYAAIRPRFNTNIKAGLVTSVIFCVFTSLFLAHFVNLGLFSIKMYLIFLLFNVIELPIAVLFGASIYGDG